MVLFGIFIALATVAFNLFFAWLDCIAWGWFVTPILHLAAPTTVLMYGFQSCLSLVFGISAGHRIYETAKETLDAAAGKIGVGGGALEKYRTLAQMTLALLYTIFIYAVTFPILYIIHLFV